jgi:phenylpropionate dioxygenase-like ring-hydroxylating dioxygenase large terminal subunit
MTIPDPTLLSDWHVVARAADLPAGHPVPTRLLGTDLVLWRSNGRAHAWRDLCVHRGTRLSLGRVEDGCLVCPYHGWTYDETGQCVAIPAHPEQTPPVKARAATYHVRERYGLIWVCLGEPANEIAPFPEWDDPAFRKIFCGPYPVQAGGPRIVENFLDIAHFPFVHEGILGDIAHPEIEEYQAEIGPDGVVAEGVRVYQPDPYGTGVGDTVSYTYRVHRPLTASLTKESDGPRFTILLMVTPHDLASSSAWIWMAQNYGHDIPEEELVAYQDEIFLQDRPIVESQRPELLPLDLQAELHLRSDRTAIAYRRWLHQLGVTFGTA